MVGKCIGSFGISKNGRKLVIDFNVLIRLDGGGGVISHGDRNIKNNQVKFSDNLPFIYFKARRKQQRFDEK